MNIKIKEYKATTGYADIVPGITPFEFQTHVEEDTGITIFKPSNAYASNLFNEVQVSGDPDLRRSLLPEGDDGSSILFNDNPDYDALFFRRRNMGSKGLPLNVDDEFIRRWVALSSGDQEVIELGILYGREFFGGGAWGGIEDIKVKKKMLPYISNMDQTTKDALKKVDNDAQWAADFIFWRNNLSGRIKFKEV